MDILLISDVISKFGSQYKAICHAPVPIALSSVSNTNRIANFNPGPNTIPNPNLNSKPDLKPICNPNLMLLMK